MKENQKNKKLCYMLLFSALAVILSICFTAMTYAATIIPSKPKVGDGTTDNPYQISNAKELYWFALLVNNSTLTDDEKLTTHNAVLISDIVINSGTMTATSTNVTEWTPIKNYNAVFDGQNHSISGLYFNDNTSNYVGLFGSTKTSSSVIKNVIVDKSYFNGCNYVGGICGSSSGLISNCSSNNIIEAAGNLVGGISGKNSYQINGCNNRSKIYVSMYHGNISGVYIGGICGYGNIIYKCNNFGSVESCVSYMSLRDGINVGGICGRGVKITSCENSGKISGTYSGSKIYSIVNRIAGICGNCVSSSTLTSKISSCMNKGTIYSSAEAGSVESQAAGICSYIGGEIVACANSGSVTSYSTSTEDISYAYAAGICCKSTNAYSCYNIGQLYAMPKGVIRSKTKRYDLGICIHPTAQHNYYLSGTASYCDDYGLYEELAVSLSDFQSGMVTYNMNKGLKATGWYQNIDLGNADANPTLDSDHYIVYYLSNENKYTNYKSISMGTCGGEDSGLNQFYSSDISTNTLTITGDGAMADYTSANNAPWYSDRAYIKYLVVDKDVVFDDYALYGLRNLRIVYCYENSPVANLIINDYNDNNFILKYIVDSNSIKIDNINPTDKTFTVTVNTNDFGGNGAKYLEEVRIIVNNDDTDRGIKNYSDDETDDKYINFNVSYTDTTGSDSQVRAEVIAKNTPEDTELIYYVTDVYDFATGA